MLHRLQELQGPAEIAALYLRASAWFAANGYLDEALHQALAAPDWAAAQQVVIEHRHLLMNQSQWQRLERWMNLFPREVIDKQPDLLLINISLKIIRQQINEVPARSRRAPLNRTQPCKPNRNISDKLGVHGRRAIVQADQEQGLLA